MTADDISTGFSWPLSVQPINTPASKRTRLPILAFVMRIAYKTWQGGCKQMMDPEHTALYCRIQSFCIDDGVLADQQLTHVLQLPTYFFFLYSGEEDGSAVAPFRGIITPELRSDALEASITRTTSRP